MTTISRSRWAAIGAAVAVTLGAGGIGISHATTDSGDGPVSAFFPIEPCRLAANEAVAQDSSITLDGWGMSGDCDLPSDITGLAANVTAVGATAQTNLRFYAAGADLPETANLNPSPGAPPAPNAVNITLSDTTGQFNVYNRFGTVAVFIDVMGYYDNHTHDDRYYTEAEVDTALGDKANTTDVYTKAEVDTALDGKADAGVSATAPFMVMSDDANAAFDGTDTVVQTLDVDAPSTGTVLVNYSLIVSGDDGDRAVCNVGTSAVFEDAAGVSSGDTSQAGGRTALAGTRVFDIAAGTTTFSLVCFVFGDVDTESAFSPTITALFTPTSG